MNGFVTLRENVNSLMNFVREIVKLFGQDQNQVKFFIQQQLDKELDLIFVHRHSWSKILAYRNIRNIAVKKLPKDNLL